MMDFIAIAQTGGGQDMGDCEKDISGPGKDVTGAQITNVAKALVATTATVA